MRRKAPTMNPVDTRRALVEEMPSPRFERFLSYCNKNKIGVINDHYNKKYEFRPYGAAWFITLHYWQVNQPYDNVIALLTRRLCMELPQAPQGNRCTACGCANVQAEDEATNPFCVECHSSLFASEII